LYQSYGLLQHFMSFCVK